jgi:hypothetical protein
LSCEPIDWWKINHETKKLLLEFYFLVENFERITFLHKNLSGNNTLVELTNQIYFGTFEPIVYFKKMSSPPSTLSNVYADRNWRKGDVQWVFDSCVESASTVILKYNLKTEILAL